MIRGAHGVGEGIDPSRKDEMVPKFFEDGLLIVRAGGPAGLFSGILRVGPVPVTKKNVNP